MRKQVRILRRVETGLYRHEIDGVKQGSYYALYSHNSQRVQESLKTEDLAEARRELKKRKALDDKLDGSLRSLTFAAAIDRWLATRTDGAKTTIRNDGLFTARLKTQWPGGAGVKVREIKPSEVLAFISGLKKATGEPVGNSYRNHLGWALRSIFDLCVRDGVIDQNPAASFEGKMTKDIIRQTPTREQFTAIVEKIRSRRMSDTASVTADLVEFMGLGGVGTAECAALQWQDVDLKKEEIHLLRRKTGKAFTIKIYPKLRPLMERLAAKRGAAEAYVFSIKDPKVAISSACRDLGLPKFSARSFRRMFITEALEAGVDVGIVARTQGHRDGGVLILRTYRNIRPKYEKDQLELLK